MKYLLRDNSTVTDPRLDRLVQFDERSKNFPIMKLIPEAKRKFRSYTWRCNTCLNQGPYGSCVGHGIAHELAARPSEVPGMTTKYAKEEIYWKAQMEDPWPGGDYPNASPKYEGTSVLAGVKVAQRLGWFDSYYWAFSLEELIYGVGHRGPAVLGTYWFDGMMQPDEKGLIHPEGGKAGGHCYLVKGVDINRELLRILNSWGKPWGIDGECYITFDDMRYLLELQGEAVFFEKRHKVPRITA